MSSMGRFVLLFCAGLFACSPKSELDTKFGNRKMPAYNHTLMKNLKNVTIDKQNYYHMDDEFKETYKKSYLQTKQIENSGVLDDIYKIQQEATVADIGNQAQNIQISAKRGSMRQGSQGQEVKKANVVALPDSGKIPTFESQVSKSAKPLSTPVDASDKSVANAQVEFAKKDDLSATQDSKLSTSRVADDVNALKNDSSSGVQAGSVLEIGGGDRAPRPEKPKTLTPIVTNGRVEKSGYYLRTSSNYSKSDISDLKARLNGGYGAFVRKDKNGYYLRIESSAKSESDANKLLNGIMLDSGIFDLYIAK